ncbi:hypothetical protein DVH05_020344 [Phytophthora capsici]|nr:hypothetical protein DVH05_020344 [Phytophthora capsici]
MQTLVEGQTLLHDGRYRFLRRIGSGTFAVIMRCVLPPLNALNHPLTVSLQSSGRAAEAPRGHQVRPPARTQRPGRTRSCSAAASQ